VNDVPIAVPQALNQNEDGTLGITLAGSDVETAAGDLTYAIADQPAHGTVKLVGNTATYTPAANYNGPDSFTFSVTDTGDPAGTPGNVLTSAVATVSITVDPVNDAPIAAPQSVTVDEDGSQQVTLSGSPDAIPFAMFTTSAFRPKCSEANMRPVRPIPDCTSSTTRTMPCCDAISRSPWRNAAGGTT
jgi:hypothetical protein